METPKPVKFILLLPGLLALVAAFALLISFPVMWLVNYILSEEALRAVFGGPLDIFKALLLTMTCGILFQSRSAK